MWLKTLCISFCLLLCVHTSVFAIEFLITEQQLIALETNIEVLESNNNELQRDLKKLREQSESQEQSLKIANEYFEKYAASQKNKLRELKAQRCLLVAGLLIAIINR